MKKRFLLYFLGIIVFVSCKNTQDEMTELNSFLQTNYEFNTRAFNQYRGDYYQRIEEQPSRKNENLNQLDLKYELLIKDIDKAISSKEDNLEKIVADYQTIVNEIPEIVNHRKDYLPNNLDITKLNTSGSKEFYLNFIKNRLTIAMAYAFEYAGRITGVADGLYTVEVDSITTKRTENGIKLTLASKHGQSIKENRHIIINSIEFNGHEKNFDFNLKDNYSFADIELDSLQNGNYKINGILRFYHRERKFDIPFEKEFKVE